MAALAVGHAVALREQYVAEHKILMKSFNDYLGVDEAGKDLILYAAGKDAFAPLKKQYRGFVGCRLDSTLNDQPSMPENCNQDDNSAEAQVKGYRVQQPLGPNHKHHCVLHAARLVPGVTWQLLHCGKRH
jgi:hypothetical protein